MTTLVPEARPRSLFWRVLQVIAGIALFLYSLRLLQPMPGDRGGFIVLVAVLAAGSMALSDSLVGLVAAVFDKMQTKGNE